MKWWYWPIGLLVLITILPTLIHRTGRTDLGILIEASNNLIQGRQVYRIEDVNEHTKPPLATLAMVPLTWIPYPVLCRIWDVLNLAAFVFLVWFLVKHVGFSKHEELPAAILTGFIVLNPFNQELRLGQYNILFFAFMVWAGIRKRAWWMGISYALAVLFKPTFVLMGPWLCRQSPSKVRSTLAGAGVVVVLIAAYVQLFGWSRFIDDTYGWSTFLKVSSAKHLGRPNNNGFPSELAPFIGSGSESWMLLLGLVGLAFAAWKWKSLEALALTSVLLIVLSPMAWMQNFTLLVPAVVWLLVERKHTIAIVLWLGTGLLNPTTARWVAYDTWSWQRIPLWSVIIGAVLLVAARFYPGSKRLRRAR